MRIIGLVGVLNTIAVVYCLPPAWEKLKSTAIRQIEIAEGATYAFDKFETLASIFDDLKATIHSIKKKFESQDPHNQEFISKNDVLGLLRLLDGHYEKGILHITEDKTISAEIRTGYATIGNTIKHNLDLLSSGQSSVEPASMHWPKDLPTPYILHDDIITVAASTWLELFLAPYYRLVNKDFIFENGGMQSYTREISFIREELEMFRKIIATYDEDLAKRMAKVLRSYLEHAVFFSGRYDSQAYPANLEEAIRLAHLGYELENMYAYPLQPEFRKKLKKISVKYKNRVAAYARARVIAKQEELAKMTCQELYVKLRLTKPSKHIR